MREYSVEIGAANSGAGALSARADRNPTRDLVDERLATFAELARAQRQGE